MIRWIDPNPLHVERAVQILARLVADTRPIDGSGGAGGTDSSDSRQPRGTKSQVKIRARGWMRGNTLSDSSLVVVA